MVRHGVCASACVCQCEQTVQSVVSCRFFAVSCRLFLAGCLLFLAEPTDPAVLGIYLQCVFVYRACVRVCLYVPVCVRLPIVHSMCFFAVSYRTNRPSSCRQIPMRVFNLPCEHFYRACSFITVQVIVGVHVYLCGSACFVLLPAVQRTACYSFLPNPPVLQLWKYTYAHVWVCCV